VIVAPLQAVQEQFDGYDPGHRRKPLGPYAVLTTTFAAGFAAAVLAGHRRRGGLPARYGVLDIVTTGIATHKLSRLITKDKVTAFARAPFVTYQEPAGHGEVEEEPRGDGLRYAIGELLVCPYCVGQWVVGALAAGMIGAPEATRLITFMYTAEAIADFLQIGYKAGEEALGG
jgi:hypothetical protein